MNYYLRVPRHCQESLRNREGTKNEISTRYQVLSYFITITLPLSICQKQVISFRILGRCIQVKTKKGEIKGVRPRVVLTQTEASYIRLSESKSFSF